jgi:hypothetical protein
MWGDDGGHAAAAADLWCREDAIAALELYLKYIEQVEPDQEVLMRYHLSQLVPQEQL